MWEIPWSQGTHSELSQCKPCMTRSLLSIFSMMKYYLVLELGIGTNWQEHVPRWLLCGLTKKVRTEFPTQRNDGWIKRQQARRTWVCSTYSYFNLLHPWSPWATKKEIHFSRPFGTHPGWQWNSLPSEVHHTWECVSFSPRNQTKPTGPSVTICNTEVWQLLSCEGLQRPGVGV